MATKRDEKRLPTRVKTLNLYANDEELGKIASALSVKIRRDVMRVVNEGSCSVNDVAWKLSIPVSTASFHVRALVDAGLLSYLPHNKRGNEKQIVLGSYVFNFYLGNPTKRTVRKQVLSQNIPIGSYTNFSVGAPCGLAVPGEKLYANEPAVFHHPRRNDADILWFTKGFVEYTVPFFNYVTVQNFGNVPFDKSNVLSLAFSFELCSEAPLYNHDFKSDVTFFVNGLELHTYRSKGDFGERRGRLTKAYIPDSQSQYGLLHTLDVRFDGTYFDEKRVNDVGIEDLHLTSGDLITFRIAVKDDAKYVGGVNLFGKNCGDFAQDIVMSVTHKNNLDEGITL